MGTAIQQASLDAYIYSGQANRPLNQQAEWEAAKARHLDELPTVADALAVLPAVIGQVYLATYLQAVDDLLECPADDAPFAQGIVRALADNIRDRAAGTLAQRDIDAAMDAVRAEMEFDRMIGNLPIAA